MCVPIASALKSLGSVRNAGKLMPKEATNLSGNRTDQLLRLAILDPFQSNGGITGEVVEVGNLTYIRTSKAA